MKIRGAELVISAPSAKQYPQDEWPEFALVGRSNVGKSSLINRLVSRKSLARTSSQPGKTQLLNFYRVEAETLQLYLVDLPGYGYAKVSKAKRQQWGNMIESYLRKRQFLRGVIQLIDARHPPTEDDRLMYDWLRYYEIPLTIVMTKADKVPKGRWEKQQKIVRESLSLPASTDLILFSTEMDMGRELLWAKLAQALHS